MLTMLKRHEVEILRKAGHPKCLSFAKTLLGFGIRNLQTVSSLPLYVLHVSDAQHHLALPGHDCASVLRSS